MEVLKSFGHFVFLTQVYFTVSQDMITIIRNPGDGDQWTDLDQFKLPDSKCSSVCTNWKAHPFTSCHCKCSYSQEATFGFYSGSWTCLDNTEVRKQTGNCKYKFHYEQDGYPLRILDQGTQYNVILSSSGCSVDQTKSRYFKCDGSSDGIDSQSFSQWFSINSYKVTIGSGISTHLLGRIISLNIICQQEQSCLLFKLKGTFQCAENVTSIITSPSSAIPITNASVVIPATATTLAPNFQTTAKPNYDAKRSGGSSTVVSVVVTLVIIIVIAIVIVAYVYLKRKRGESVWLVDYISSSVRKFRSTQPAKMKRVDETVKDPVYAEIPEEQRKNEPSVDQAGGIYSYAFDDPQTAYIAPQPAPYNRLEHKQQGLNQEGALYSTADDGPVYNVLERPLAENNIIMAPENTVNEGPPSQVLEPEYLVLEELDTTNGNKDVRPSIGTANPSGPQNVAPKSRRRPPSPPRKI